MNNPTLLAASGAQPTASAHAAAATSSSPPLPLAGLHLPEAPGIWPLAWGWWALFAIIILVIIIAFFTWRKYKKNRRAKRAALRLLTNMCQREANPNKKVALANDLLRQACLAYYPRGMLASLHGNAWYKFLDQQAAETSTSSSFSANQTEWQQALYQKQPISDALATGLIQQVEQWVEGTLPPSKKQLKAANLVFKPTAETETMDSTVSKARVVKTTTVAKTEKLSANQDANADQQDADFEPLESATLKRKEPKDDV
ncbi:DUF4381 domain-containing protein [Vibrio algicola]|uniref:DUF4381 family protein n=1 Tax=Vibrio algicola TaxID=2662262 RepID=A0A5Q0TGU0_9VIBR|nr:DUF4381 domain-containing protein [Vibrio algicola]